MVKNRHGNKNSEWFKKNILGFWLPLAAITLGVLLAEEKISLTIFTDVYDWVVEHFQ